mgnify:CR=1 FL=1|jgi:hypothetical protein
MGSRVAHAGMTGPCEAQTGTTGPRVALEEASRPHVVQQRRKAGCLWGEGNRIELKEGVEIGGWGGASKGKHIFVEDDVTREGDAV